MIGGVKRRWLHLADIDRFVGLIAMVVLVATVLGVVSVAAQYTTASLGGTVADPAGAMVPGAEVTVQNEDTGLTRTVTTQIDGAFLFPALPIGHCKLTVAKSGFTTYGACPEFS